MDKRAIKMLQTKIKVEYKMAQGKTFHFDRVAQFIQDFVMD